jgi:F420-dependent oxidoreductase-like protein
VRIGLQIPSYTWPGGAPEIRTRLAEIARTAEEAGFASIWVMDHFFQIDSIGPVDDPMLEAYTALGFLAAVTERAQLGTLVTGAFHRHPGVLVKSVSTLDVLSGGRAYLGIGAGWYERECLGLGIPFPSVSERFERLEETLQIARQMWSGQVGTFEGRHYHLAETMNCPQPLSRPHPPIMIGGMGEKKTLRLVAQYADACNLYTYDTDEIAHKLAVLRSHCGTIDRPFDEIERTAAGTAYLAPGEMTVSQVTTICRDLARVGIQQLIFNMPNVHELAPLDAFGREIIPQVRDM